MCFFLNIPPENFQDSYCGIFPKTLLKMYLETLQGTPPKVYQGVSVGNPSGIYSANPALISSWISFGFPQIFFKVHFKISTRVFNNTSTRNSYF